MRTLSMAALLLANNWILADDAVLFAKQKQAAEKSFESLQSGPRHRAESAHFFVIGSLPEARLRAMASALEKTHGTATKGLQFEDNAPPWNGKLAVLVFNEPAGYRSYVRQITKRSPAADESNSSDLDNTSPTMGINIGAFKDPVAVDSALQNRLATALIYKRAKSDKIPDWIVAGFVKATAVQGTSLVARKRQIIKLNLGATAAWSKDLPVDIRNQVAASVIEYLFYAKTVKPSEFLAAFRPETELLLDVEIPISVYLEKVNLSPEKVDLGWRQWLAKP